MSFAQFNQPITVIRRNAGSYDHGNWTEGTEQSRFTIMASIQPASDREIQILPEARRTDAIYVLYTDTKLNTSERKTQTNSDIVILFGEEYEILSVGYWQNSVIPHYKVMCARLHHNMNDLP